MISLRKDTAASLIKLQKISSNVEALSFNDFIFITDELLITKSEENKTALQNLFTDLGQTAIQSKNPENIKNFIRSLMNLREKFDLKLWRTIALSHFLAYIDKVLCSEKLNRQALLDLIQEELTTMQHEVKKYSTSPELDKTLPKNEPSTFWKNLKSILILAALFVIAIIGIAKGASEGFNAINSLITVIPGLSQTPLAFTLWGVFVAVGVIMYIGFDYRNIAKALGFNFLSMRGTLKDCHQECKQIKNNQLQIIGIINELNNQKPNEETNLLRAKINLFKEITDKQLEHLRETKKTLDNQPQNPTLKMMGKIFVGLLGGTLFLSSGFFGGHAIMLDFGYLATEPFTLAVSGVIALACLVSYIFLEFEGFLSLVDLITGTSDKLSKKVDDSLGELEKIQKTTNSFIEQSEQKIQSEFHQSPLTPPPTEIKHLHTNNTSNQASSGSLIATQPT